MSTRSIRSLGLSEGSSETDDDFGAGFADGFAEQTDGTDGADPAAERRSILERLARKEISAEDAAAALRDLETGS